MSTIDSKVMMLQPGSIMDDVASVSGTVELQIHFQGFAGVDGSPQPGEGGIYKLDIQEKGSDEAELTLDGPGIDGTVVLPLSELLEMMITRGKGVDIVKEENKEEIEIHTSNPGKQGIVAGYLKDPSGTIIQVMAKEGESKEQAIDRVKKNHPGSNVTEYSPNPGWHDVEEDIPEWAIPDADEKLDDFVRDLKKNGSNLLEWLEKYADIAKSRRPDARVFREL